MERVLAPAPHRFNRLAWDPVLFRRRLELDDTAATSPLLNTTPVVINGSSHLRLPKL